MGVEEREPSVFFLLGPSLSSNEFPPIIWVVVPAVKRHLSCVYFPQHSAPWFLMACTLGPPSWGTQCLNSVEHRGSLEVPALEVRRWF